LGLVVLVWLGVNAALHREKGFSDLLAFTLKLLRNDPRWDPDKLLPPRTEATPTPDNRTARRARARIDKGRSKHDPRGAGDPFTVSDLAFTQATSHALGLLGSPSSPSWPSGSSTTPRLVTFNGFRSWPSMAPRWN
jgi:hypothetical protein